MDLLQAQAFAHKVAQLTAALVAEGFTPEQARAFVRAALKGNTF